MARSKEPNEPPQSKRPRLGDSDAWGLIVIDLQNDFIAAMNQFDTVILEDCTWTAQEVLGQSALQIFRDAFGQTASSRELVDFGPLSMPAPKPEMGRTVKSKRH